MVMTAGVTLSGPAPAQEVDNDFNLYFGGNKVWFDDDRALEDEVGIYYGLELPVPIGERSSLVFERYDMDTDLLGTSGSADYQINRVGTNYHLSPMGGWQPYLSLGIGQLEIDPALTEPDVDETSYDIGLGFKRDFLRNLIFKADLKGIHGRRTSDWDLSFGLSLGLTFGGAEPREVASAPPPEPVQPAPPADSDGDGVPDSRDMCPDTPRELAVDENGCPILDTELLRQEILVEFAFDSDEIIPAYRGQIEEFADFMRMYPNTSVTIEGHTDDTGPEAYNQGLSERRAEAVRRMLVEDFNIDPARLSTVGYGESRPVASNDSREGRARNRRIIADVSVEVQEPRRR